MTLVDIIVFLLISVWWVHVLGLPMPSFDTQLKVFAICAYWARPVPTANATTATDVASPDTSLSTLEFELAWVEYMLSIGYQEMSEAATEPAHCTTTTATTTTTTQTQRRVHHMPIRTARPRVNKAASITTSALVAANELDTRHSKKAPMKHGVLFAATSEVVLAEARDSHKSERQHKKPLDRNSSKAPAASKRSTVTKKSAAANHLGTKVLSADTPALPTTTAAVPSTAFRQCIQQYDDADENEDQFAEAVRNADIAQNADPKPHELVVIDAEVNIMIEQLAISDVATVPEGALVANADTAPEYAPVADADTTVEEAPVADIDTTAEDAPVADVDTALEDAPIVDAAPKDAPVANADTAPEYAPVADADTTVEKAPVADIDTTAEGAPVADVDTALEDAPIVDAVPEDALVADVDATVEDAPVAKAAAAPEDAPVTDTDAAPKDASIVDAAPEEAPVANAAATAVNALATTDAHPAQPEELRLTSNMDSDAAVDTSAQAETPPVANNCAHAELTLATLAEASAGEVPAAAIAPLAVKLPAANADTRIGELPVADVDMENSKPHSIDVDMQGGELLEADAEMHAEDSPAADNVMMVEELPAAATGMQVDESLGLGVYMDVVNDQPPHLLGEPSSMPLPDISYIDIGALANDIQNAWPQSIASETAQSLEYLVGVVPSAPGDFNQANAAVGANVQAMSSTAPWPNNCDWSASACASAGGFDFDMLDESIGGFDFGNAGNSGVGFGFGSAASGSLGNNPTGNVLCMDPCLFNWDNVGFTPRADNLENATGAPFNNSSLSCEATTAIVDSMDIDSLLEMVSHLTPEDFAELDAKVAAAGIIIDGDAANRYAADTALAMLADTAAMAPMAPTEGAAAIPATPTESTVTTVPATPTESAGADSASATPADSTDAYELYRPSSIAECSKWAAIRPERNTAASNKRSGNFTARCNGKRARNNGKQAVSEF